MKLSTLRCKEIPTAVSRWCEGNASSTGYTYASYLEYIRGEVVERIFASRRFKKDGVKIHEVIRCATGKSATIARDLIYYGMNGYTPMLEAKDKYQRQCGYGIKIFDKADFGKWYVASGHIGVSYVYINPDMIKSIPEFKYCGYSGGDVIRYLNAYRRDSSLEFFGKLGLPLSAPLISKAKKDGQFRKFLYNNHAGVSEYGVQATLYAYKHGLTIGEARKICIAKNALDRKVSELLNEVKNSKLDRKKVLDYVDRNNINYASYNDYLKCCKSLGLNLTDTKVIFPNDFARMHEMRTDEYAAQEAKADRAKRAELYEAFTRKAQEYKPLETSNGTYSLICPQDISELVREGEFLKHCVGKMGYDKKVVDGKSIIMFVRKCDDITVPHATVEYRIDRKAVSQCYGYSDSKPADDVVSFVNTWAMSVCAEFLKTRSYQNITNDSGDGIMRIGLIDVDGHNFPNLALMKISAYHKAKGDTVEWCFPMSHYDIVYQSKVFDDTYSPDIDWIPNADKLIKGGTGYGLDNTLPSEIEHIYPDYSIYPELTKDTAYGFLTRGCPRGCEFCIVASKEGRKSYKVADLSEFWRGQKKIVLLDPNILACKDRMNLLDQLIESKAVVDFSQGLDIRLTNEAVAEKLNRIRIKRLHFAWDNPEQDLTPYFKSFTEAYNRKSCSGKVVYTLVNFNSTMEQNLYRIYTLRDLGYDPYVMVYDKPNAPKEIKDLQRWVNNRFIFRKCKRFEDYKKEKQNDQKV